MGSNIIHLVDYAVPSYRRTRAPAVSQIVAAAQPPHNTWTDMARHRAAQKLRLVMPADQANTQNPALAITPAIPSAGHLRLSGRLADVCAELERLAAAEAAQIAA
ncbi:hypothetical protein [Ottowia sp.]|uniref:hypothetical protein n=1 Tax=Ottowia sp. TaxID=1898956 RepID=UPI003A8BD950